MAQPPVAPIIPNMGATEEAIAASAEMIFTATDRKLIQERAGEVDRSRSFREVFREENLTPEVENEETTVQEGKNAPELEERLKIHSRMLRDSPFSAPKEKVVISEEEKLDEKLEEASAPLPSKPDSQPKVSNKTAAMIKELNLDPVELVSKFSLDEKELHELVYRIKDLHLKRVLSSSQADFEGLSQKIKKETLSVSKKEARKWLEAKLDELTLNTAQYKLNLVKSLQSLEYSREREKDIKWLRAVCAPAG